MPTRVSDCSLCSLTCADFCGGGGRGDAEFGGDITQRSPLWDWLLCRMLGEAATPTGTSGFYSSSVQNTRVTQSVTKEPVACKCDIFRRSRDRAALQQLVIGLGNFSGVGAPRDSWVAEAPTCPVDWPGGAGVVSMLFSSKDGDEANGRPILVRAVATSTSSGSGWTCASTSRA